MFTQVITLKITIDNDNYNLPDQWDWMELLDLAPNESVEIISKIED